jgi:CheY-like chemotaxis protein
MASKDLLTTTALVIDGSSLSRTVAVGLLNDIGVGMVFQASRPEEGRRMMETQVFDFVLCDYDFAGSPMTGQALLDDLRASKLLPLATVFFMVTGEASYSKVAEAVESALDNYLLKPYSPSALAARIRDCRDRKVTLKALFDAVDAERYADVIARCEALADERGRYWQFAARIGAEVALRTGAWQRAERLYEQVLAVNYLPWARLGIANARFVAGESDRAQELLSALVGASPAFVDGYDALGRLCLERGAIDDALSALRMASQLTPGSVSRLQRHGLAAFLVHEGEESSLALERATALGVNSKLFDHQSLMLLALLKFDDNDAPALRRYRDILQNLVDRSAAHYRLTSYVELFEILRLMLNDKMPAALEAVSEFALRIDEPRFDFELACAFLGVLDRVIGQEVALPRYAGWASRMALRFCVSRGSSEILLRFVDVVEGEEAINEGFAQVNRLSQSAMAGDPVVAGRQLVEYAEETYNARIAELAALVIRQHESEFPDAPELLERVETLRTQYCAPSLQTGAARTLPAGLVALRRTLGDPSSA